jgi:Zn-finger nucleic acid-binding protein
MSERQGIEIDYCPQCRGIWLDRGELDKIIEKSAAIENQNVANQPPQPPQHQSPNFPTYEQQRQQEYYRRKQKNWLNDLFD